MRRRTFLQTLPLAAAGSAVSAQTPASAPVLRLPKFQAPGEDRFVRPDVHAGDRPSGASFATRSAAMGRSGAAGTAHPLATLTAIEMLSAEARPWSGGCGECACSGSWSLTSCGLGGGCYAMVWDPKPAKWLDWRVRGARRNRWAGDGAAACGERSDSEVWRGRGFDAGCAGRVVDAASALRTMKWEEILQPAIHLARGACRCRRSSGSTSSAIWRHF